MTNKLRQIAESKGREFWVNIHGEVNKGYITGDPITDDIPFKLGIERVIVIDKSTNDKLAAALKKACAVIDLQREALEKLLYKKTHQESVVEVNPVANEALAAAEKIMEDV